MLFWVSAAIMTAAVVLAIIWPLARGFGADADGAADLAADANVYRDQLAEIDRDLDRGVITDTEAEAARIEISRRLLAADAAAHAADGGAQASLFGVSGENLRKAAALFCAAFLPLSAFVAYLVYGAGGAPDLPRSARLQTPIERTPVAELISRVEARLREKPDDGQGWDVIAPVYTRVGRFQDAKVAYERAIELQGESDRRLAGLAQVVVTLARGRVTPEAEKLYTRLAALRPDWPFPKFWLAVAKEQRGALVEARDDYQALLKDAPKEARWRASVERRIAAVSQRLSGAPLARATPPEAAPSQPKPQADAGASQTKAPKLSRDQVAAVSAMSPEDRRNLISDMVGGLAARLQENGDDPAGWKRLIRAYMVLGDRKNALAALDRAREALVDKEEKRRDVETFAQSLGLGSS